MALVSSVSFLLAECNHRRTAIREAFDAGGSAGGALDALCDLADQMVKKLFGELFASSEGLAIMATGGYGGRRLFPHSDLDVLILFSTEEAENQTRPLIGELSRTLWDVGFRTSFAGRTLQECKRVEQDNVEFHLALLDRRFLAGDAELYRRFDGRVLGAVEQSSRDFLVGELVKFVKERHTQFGNTIFHLEPNVKEVPGSLRDYHAAHWLEILTGKASGASRLNESEEVRNALEFINSVRCFLHYVNGRNDNSLTYELQAAAAERSLGINGAASIDPGEWMRVYYRHARTLNRELLSRLEPLTVKRPGFIRPLSVFSGRSNARVKANGDVFAPLAGAAETGVALSREEDGSVLEMWRQDQTHARTGREAWRRLRRVLGANHPGVALRTMHRLGILFAILPEFRAIDALVVRDFYHRYTVDEHSLRTIENLQELGSHPAYLGVRFSNLWKTVSQRELLVFALLLHDVGKGTNPDDHVTGGLEALETAAERLGLTPEEKDEVHFLIGQHLAMSATILRRDIFDPATVSSFADIVGMQDRLNRLCLLTYADITAVNPEAMTPWKADMLWQLFAATSNHLSRSLDRDRLRVEQEAARMQEIPWPREASQREVEQFLEGFPRRYLAMHSPAEIAGHFCLANKLEAGQVQTEIKATEAAFALTVITADRPALFATIAGVLAGWGMNIVKADAFANAAGIVLDTFYFIDLHHTLELNPGEVERFRKSLADVISGKSPLERLLAGRISASRARKPKVDITTILRFDQASSANCTLLEIIAQDHPGFLYELGTVLARLSCNIEVALINTEGQKVIDVFYLTQNRTKLELETQQRIQEELQALSA